jgi:hypothetical protein
MKHNVFIVSIAFLFLSSSTVSGEEEDILLKSHYVNQGLYLGGQASTNGWGFDVRYIINKTITIKTGFERLKLTHDFNFVESNIDFNAELDYKTGGIFLMADFNIINPLYLSIGAAQNTFKPQVKGFAVGDMKYGDITIPSSQVGDFTFTLMPGMKLSPYAGIGLRKFIGEKERASFFFESGLYYLGSPEVEIEANGFLAPTADPAHGQKELLANQFSQYNIYPVVKFSLALKLF